MKVLFVSSEAHPLVKTGGLADVAGALPPALAAAGLDIRLMLPAYPAVVQAAEDKTDGPDLGDPLGFGPTRMIEATQPGTGLPLWLVDCPSLFDRSGSPYLDDFGRDWTDNHRRFAALSWAGAFVGKVGDGKAWLPHVVHANDWQCGLIPAYLHQWRGPGPATVITIHNLQFQGNFPKDVMAELGLSQDLYSIDGMEFYGQVSFLKAGIRFSDHLTTVSPNYAREICLPENGCGMDGLLRDRRSRLTGILNGCDYDFWNAATDPALVTNYKPKTVTAGKADCKTDLQNRLDLKADPDAPLFGVVSRMSEQKGLDLVLANAERLLEAGGQLVVLGSGDAPLETAFRALGEARPGQVSVRIGYDENHSHRIQAASDFLLVPSRFEPCGLTQLYAMRYGTLPIVRRTGGLADTVIDAVDPSGTGFLFDTPSPLGLWSAMDRALALYHDPDRRDAARRRAMEQDYSWRHAADAYIALYERILSTDRELSN